MDNIKVIKAPVLKKRALNAHKGTFGTALLINGSYGMAGAAILSVRSCLRSGIGIAKMCVPDRIYDIIASAVPEAVALPVAATPEGMFSFADAEKILSALTGVSCIVFGCGIGQGKDNALILELLIKNAKCPLIIDADGINTLYPHINIIRQANAPVILTPHPGEMARLCGKSVAEIESNRVLTAKTFAKEHKVYLVLKGSGTVVATPEGEIYINETGNPGMATGGSGDTLTGIMAALISRDKDITRAVTNAVYIHGKAGDVAAERLSETAMIPSDIIDELPCLFKTLER